MSHVTKAIHQNMQHMVEVLKRKGSLCSPLVERALTAVPRHLFINRLPPYFAPDGKNWMTLDPLHPPEECLGKIYSADTAIVMKSNPPSSSSAPSVMAPMLEALKLKEGLKVLEIGAGSGYNAALMAHIVRHNDRIYTIENQPEVAKEAEANLRRSSFGGVHVICVDGGYGYAPGAPYDRIIATASIYDLPPSWREQLIEGGILVAPVRIDPWSPIVQLVKRGETLSGRVVGGAGFMALQGDCGYDESGRMINADKEEQLTRLLEQSLEEEIALPLQVEDEAHRFSRFMEFSVFVNMENPHAISLGVPSRERYSYLSLWDKEASSLVSAWMPDWKVGIYGSEVMYIRLLALLGEWQEMGAPEISSYRVSVSPGRLSVPGKEQGVYVQFRSWNTWEFAVDPCG